MPISWLTQRNGEYNILSEQSSWCAPRARISNEKRHALRLSLPGTIESARCAVQQRSTCKKIIDGNNNNRIIVVVLSHATTGRRNCRNTHCLLTRRGNQWAIACATLRAPVGHVTHNVVIMRPCL